MRLAEALLQNPIASSSRLVSHRRVAELKNEFSWSHSRETTFRRCPRQYFFTYYGSWGGWDKRSDAKTRTLYVLKQLVRRPAWSGQVVHKCINWVLDTLRKTGSPPPEEDALRNTLRRMNKDFQESGEGLYWEDPKSFCALYDHEYEEDVTDEQWENTMQRAATCVSAFYASPHMESFAKDSTSNWLALEQLASFNVDSTKAYLQPDFARRTPEGIEIYDWKTGKANAPATKEQLAVYALYASSFWKLPAEEVTTIEFNLSTGETISAQTTKENTAAALESIRTSIASMKSLLDDPATNRASEEKFALTDDDAICRTCNFKRVCPKFLSR